MMRLFKIIVLLILLLLGNRLLSQSKEDTLTVYVALDFSDRSITIVDTLSKQSNKYRKRDIKRFKQKYFVTQKDFVVLQVYSSSLLKRKKYLTCITINEYKTKYIMIYRDKDKFVYEFTGRHRKR